MKKTEKRKFLRTRFAAACVAALGAAVGARAAEPAWNMEDLHRSSCRVVGTSGGAGTQVGSGLTVGELENDYVVKTNAHAVDGGKSFVVQYFGDGAPLSVNARLDRKFYDSRKQHDVALLTASRSELGGYDPPIVPLAPPERAEIDAKKPIYACGCPGAREPQAWGGRTIGAFGRLQTFKPAPLQGQSGSGIVQRSPNGWFERRATLTYRSAETAQNYDFDAAYGLAIPVKFLYEAASGRVDDVSAPVPSGIVPLSAKVAETAAPPRYERAIWIGSPATRPLRSRRRARRSFISARTGAARAAARRRSSKRCEKRGWRFVRSTSTPPRALAPGGRADSTSFRRSAVPAALERAVAGGVARREKERVRIAGFFGEIRRQNRLNLRPERDAFLRRRRPPARRLVRPERVNPDVAGGLDVAEAHRADFAGPHSGKPLNPNHRRDSVGEKRERRVDDGAGNRLDGLGFAGGRLVAFERRNGLEPDERFRADEFEPDAPTEDRPDAVD